MKWCFISDTHTLHDKLSIPEVDVLVHSGDWSFKGTKDETEAFAKWLDKQPAKYIVVVPGNHEVEFEKCLNAPESSINWIKDHCPRAHLLIHESLSLEGFKLFGSPWTPYFFNWAWNAGRTITEAAHTFKPFIGDLWQAIPMDTDILITHGPAYNTLDHITDRHGLPGDTEQVGCDELRKRILLLPNLKVHTFGHLHLKGGQVLDQNGIKYINASVCDDRYRLHDNRKIILDL